MSKLIPFTIAQSDNITKSFDAPPAFVPRAKRDAFSVYSEWVTTELSMNMLEASERLVFQIAFWGSFFFTAYQTWILAGLLSDLRTATPS